MNQDSITLVEFRHLVLLGIVLYPIHTHINIRSNFCFRIIKRDNVGIVIVLQEILIDSQQIIVGTRNEIDVVDFFLRLVPDNDLDYRTKRCPTQSRRKFGVLLEKIYLHLIDNQIKLTSNGHKNTNFPIECDTQKCFYLPPHFFSHKHALKATNYLAALGGNVLHNWGMKFPASLEKFTMWSLIKGTPFSQTWR